MRVAELAPGLWRWTAPHPQWRPPRKRDSPSDWPQDVGCVLVEAAGEPVLIDPLVDDWDWLEQRLTGRAPHVLTTSSWHKRSRTEVLERFGGDTEAPPGVEGLRLRGAGETIYWLPEHAALVPGDRIISDGAGGLRMNPESWMGYLKGVRTHEQLRPLLEPLLDLPVERVLVSHGEPVLSGGRDALRAALA